MAVLPIGIGSAVAGGYQIERSLRFNSADSAYLNRTPGSASNRKTWTWSGWVKKSALGGTQALFTATIASPTTDSNLTSFGFNSSDRISIGGGLTTFLETSQVFRDLSAWYHLVCAVDTTQATADNRVRFYVNGSEITAFASRSNPTQNLDTAVNSTVQHNISSGQPWQARYFNGYMTEINFIDGQALTPSSFGETDSNTGVWKPKAYSGTYGTNGFYLKFADNSGTTSTTLGKDSSGNGNNWTPNNFSVTAGAGNDSLVDSPTSYGTDTGVGGEVRGNYATLNPLSTSSLITASNGNLNASSNQTASTGYRINSTFAQSSGKWYFEVTNTSGASTLMIGVGQGQITNQYPGQDANSWAYHTTGLLYNNSSTTSTTSASSVNNVIGVAFDIDAGKIWFSVNGTFVGSGNPSAGTNPAFTGLSGSLTQMVRPYGTTNADVNFGQRAFAYTAPSGFKALCTQNLPTPTIGATSTTQANDYFNIALWNGDGATSRAITGLGHAPNFVWIKKRTSGGTVNRDHVLYDIIRGTGANLRSNQTNAESTGNTDELKSFDSDGFTLGSGDNVNGATGTPPYVGWAWRANGAGSTNTAGTITSTVSANTTAGFSISTYTGNGSSSQTVGHGLGVAPGMVIIKTRSNSDNWRVWHTSLTSGQTLTLNSTAAQAASGFWPSNPSTSVVYLGTDSSVNSSTWTYVMYSFAPVAGYSAFGSYTGNGSTDGPFVFTNFRPRFVLLKVSSTTSNWTILDSVRGAYNVNQLALFSDLSGAEENTVSYSVDFLSNGFKLRTSGGAININAATIIYAAFAESPFKYSLAR